MTCVSQQGNSVYVCSYGSKCDRVGCGGLQTEKGSLRIVRQVVVHWRTRTLFQQVRCQINACQAWEGQQPSFLLPFSLFCRPIGLWWRPSSSTLTFQLLKWHPAALRKGRGITVDVVRPRSAVTCWHVGQSRRRKNILCWASLITLEMFASCLMVLQMVVPEELEWLHCFHSAIWVCGFL